MLDCPSPVGFLDEYIENSVYAAMYLSNHDIFSSSSSLTTRPKSRPSSGLFSNPVAMRAEAFSPFDWHSTQEGACESNLTASKLSSSTSFIVNAVPVSGRTSPIYGTIQEELPHFTSDTVFLELKLAPGSAEKSKKKRPRTITSDAKALESLAEEVEHPKRLKLEPSSPESTAVFKPVAIRGHLVTPKKEFKDAMPKPAFFGSMSSCPSPTTSFEPKRRRGRASTVDTYAEDGCKAGAEVKVTRGQRVEAKEPSPKTKNAIKNVREQDRSRHIMDLIENLKVLLLKSGQHLEKRNKASVLECAASRIQTLEKDNETLTKKMAMITANR